MVGRYISVGIVAVATKGDHAVSYISRNSVSGKNSMMGDQVEAEII